MGCSSRGRESERKVGGGGGEGKGVTWQVDD